MNTEIIKIQPGDGPVSEEDAAEGEGGTDDEQC